MLFLLAASLLAACPFLSVHFGPCIDWHEQSCAAVIGFGGCAVSTWAAYLWLACPRTCGWCGRERLLPVKRRPIPRVSSRSVTLDDFVRTFKARGTPLIVELSGGVPAVNESFLLHECGARRVRGNDDGQRVHALKHLQQLLGHGTATARLIDLYLHVRHGTSLAEVIEEASAPADLGALIDRYKQPGAHRRTYATLVD